MTVADRIKEKRELLGLTQLDLAKRLGLRSKTSISRIEQSEDNVSLKDVQRIADALGCSPLELMGWIDPNDDKFDEQTKRLIHYFNGLSASNRNMFEKYIEIAFKEEQKGGNKDV